MYQPARKITPKHWGYRGKEPFFKTDALIHWDSFLERNFIRLADFDLQVEELYHQPLCIHYSLNGKSLRYFPDFKMILKTNQVIIVEVKSIAFLNEPKNIIKYEVGRRYCAEKGWLYQIYTEDQINPGYFQWNLSLLRQLGIREHSKEAIQYILNELDTEVTISITDFCKKCVELEESLFYSNLYYLIYMQNIKTDLINQKINITSLLHLS